MNSSSRRSLEGGEEEVEYAKSSTTKNGSSLSKPAEAPSEEGEDWQNAPFRDVLEEFAGGTSVHGLPYALDRSHTKAWKRIIWYLLLFASLGLMCWQIGILIKDYRGYSVITSTSIEVPTSLPFPEVTVCDANSFSATLINETGIEEPINEEQMRSISEVAEDMIWFTSFNEELGLNISEVWRPVITPIGICFTFNTEKTVRRPGYFGGLFFYGIVDQGDYTDDSSRAGIMVIVHQKGTKINYQSPFTFIAPGTDSLISIEYLEYNREKDAPWSNCKSRAPEYTQGGCRADCEYEADRKACGCRDFGDPTTSLNYCTSTDWAQCNTPDYDNLECDCSQPPCYEEVYPTKVSNMAISENTLEQLAFEFSVDPEDARENYFSVTINYDTIRKQVLSESKALTPAQLLSAIGGTMGLFAGISFISIIEVFGELCTMRLLPRLWGDTRIHGVGSFA